MGQGSHLSLLGPNVRAFPPAAARPELPIEKCSCLSLGSDRSREELNKTDFPPPSLLLIATRCSDT